MDYPKSNQKIGLYNGKFTDGTADGTVKPSLDPAEWNNAVTDEILAIIVAGGLIPDETNLHQARDAIQAMIAAAVGSISTKQKSVIATGAVFAAGVVNGNPVRWDATASKWALAKADGTANDLAMGIADVTNGEVTLYGETRTGLLAGLTAGGRYYLSATGTLTTAAAADVVFAGVAKSATVLFVDFDPMASIPAASETAPGKVELATPAETLAGTDNTKGVHPAGLKAVTDTIRPGFSNVQAFAASGTFNIPAGVTKVMAEVWGGGGGGGTGGATSYCAAGGGGGGYSCKIINGLAPGGTVAVTIGAGGARGATAGASGSAGGTSSFGAYCSATGGGGGAGGAGNNAMGGAGGAGTGGDINVTGEPGGIGADLSGGDIFGGGGGTYKYPGGAQQVNNGNQTTNGLNGVNPGTGGSGGNGTSGGNGAAGQVIVWW